MSEEISLKIFELKNNIVNLLNDSGLAISIKRLVLSEIQTEVINVEYQVIQEESKKQKELKKEKNKKEREV